jgi:hypothetical protein
MKTEVSKGGIPVFSDEGVVIEVKKNKITTIYIQE